MSNLRQAAQQALEALERLWEGGFENLSDATHERVMEALKQALAEPEQPYDQTALDLCKVCGWRTLIPGDACLNCERAKQPEQEPLSLNDGRLTQYPDGSIGVGTPTPRRPLTEEEILAALVAVDPETKRLPPGFRAFARAIERAHGIGEGQ